MNIEKDGEIIGVHLSVHYNPTVSFIWWSWAVGIAREPPSYVHAYD